MHYKVSNSIIRTTGLVVLVLMINLFFGDFLQAKIATLHWVQKYHLINPRVPLVINTREEIRSSDANDLVSAVSNQKNKVAALVDTTGGARTLIGSAVVVTSDGVYLTVRSVVGDRPINNLVVIQSDGKELQVISSYFDPATSLVLIKTTGTGLSVASLSSRNDLVAGARAMMLGMQNNGEPYVLSTILSGTELMLPGVVFSDVPSRALPLQTVMGAMPGQAVLDLSGMLIGVWDGEKLVPASVAEEALSSFLSGGKIVRPKFGFYYRLVTRPEALATGGVAGFRLLAPAGEKSAVVAGLPASKAGLLTGDVIIQVGGVSVADSAVPEKLLSSARSAEELDLVVNRGGKSLSVKIQPI